MRLVTTAGCVLFLVICVPAWAALTPKEALHLAKHPEAVMIDANTCELREAVHYLGSNRLMGPGHHWALFRKARDKLPFAEGTTLEDSTVTIRFEAKPGEVFYGRGFQIDKVLRKIVSAGPMYRYVCQKSGRVDVGDLEQVGEKEAVDDGGKTAVPAAERPRN